MGAGRAPASLAAGVWQVVACAGLAALATGGCPRSRLPPRADGAAVVVIAPDANGDPGLPVLAEVEPNGTLANAQKIDLAVPSGLVVRGSFSATAAEPSAKGRDVDVYRLVVTADAAAPPSDAARTDAASPRAPARRRLSALVHPDLGLALVVEALDDAGQLLASAAGGQAGEDEGIPSLAVTPGTYFLRVRAAPGAGPAGGDAGYRLALRLGPAELGEELEPNGKATLATELSAAGEAVGYFGWRRDQDWYRVPLEGLPEGSALSADLEAVPGVTASLVVLDSVERKLTEVRGRKEERVAVRNIRLPPGEPHLFLQVRADAGHNLEVRYNLRVRTEVAKPGAAGGDLEPNDDPQHANPLADGTVQGYLGRGDIDVYRYTAAEALELDIEAAPPERVDIKLEVVREPDGLLLVRADSGRRQEPERLPNLFVPGGTLLIRLTAGKGDGNPDEPYRLTVASHRPEPGAEREPNGTAASATPIPAGGSGNGLLFPRGDVDFWQAPATADAEGNVAVTATGVSGLALDLHVSSLAGKELGRFKISGDAPVTNRLAVGAEACCVVQVRDATGKAANFRDRYTVTVGR
ncbi:MAG TPA: hypothetical protein VFH68_20495 [Polyangia bacterium]|jgi:hypothetical protein|nr:hypothetical protein [Polyangia bacterium]